METIKINTGVNSFSTLKGRAKHTYTRVMAAIAEDTAPSMCHTFAALPGGAKEIALQSGKYSNFYIRGVLKDIAAAKAAKELAEHVAAHVSRKLRSIDMICAVAFLTEYISRRRKENANEIPANVTFTEYYGDTDYRDFVDTINVDGVERGKRVRRMRGLFPANDSEYYAIYIPDWSKADQVEAALKAAGHKATPAEYGVIVHTWTAFMKGVEMLNPEQPAKYFNA